MPDAVTVVDTVKPSSAATSPAVSTGRSLTVNYAAVDQGAGIKEVELWVGLPGTAGYELSAVDPTPLTPNSRSPCKPATARLGSTREPVMWRQVRGYTQVKTPRLDI